MLIATLVAAEAVAMGDISEAADRLTDAGLEIRHLPVANPVDAVDLFLDGDVKVARAALEPLRNRLDYCVQPSENREKNLLISDMDSTIIAVECIDELADYAGIKPQIAAITERAMQGELDFESALRERVALLEGLDAGVIETCLRERVTLTPGAATLVRTMAARGSHTVLVSGGFTAFAGPVAEQAGFAEHLANVLAMADGKLNGTIEGAIVDSGRKRQLLETLIAERGLSAAQTLAVGDGANDIPMIEAAGLGVAYHAKPKARDAADAAIDHGDLTVLLAFQGIARDQWVTD